MAKTKKSEENTGSEPVKKTSKQTLSVQLEKAFQTVDELTAAIEGVIRGKHREIRFLLTGLLAGGHVLLEDLPGLGKTTLAKTLARLISKTEQGKAVDFKRIQFTPDLLPYDITGVDIFDPKTRKFQFNPGPAFTNILLADEINRTTPKVQSALLEVMAEKQITIGTKTHVLDPLFFVIATQNPIETEGTYPLPIAQIDRFIMKLSLGYPSQEVEESIIIDDPSQRIMPGIKSVCGKTTLLGIMDLVDQQYCDEKLIKAVVAITSATRKHRGIEWGASPRASLALVRASRAYALINHRDYVIDQDIIDLAPLVLGHRLKLKSLKNSAQEMVKEIVAEAFSKIDY